MEYVDQMELFIDSNEKNQKFKCLNTTDQNLVIHLGLQMYERGLKNVQLWNNSMWEEKINNIEEKKNKEIEILNENIKSKQNSIENLLVEQREQIITIKKEVEEQVKSIYKSQVEDYKEKLKTKEQKLAEERNKLWDVKKSFHEDLMKKIDSVRLEEEKKRNSLRENYDTLLEIEREKYLEFNKRKENSTLLGQDGESFTYNKLNLMFPKSEIIDTHNEKESGDFTLNYKNIPILLEVKNYKGNVLKKEIEKFYRDMNVQSQMKAGIFISLKSGISAREDFNIEICDGKPIIFLTYVKDNMKKIKLAANIISTIVSENIDLTNEQIMGGIKKIIPNIKRSFNKIKGLIEKNYKKLNELTIDQESQIIELFKIIGMKY